MKKCSGIYKSPIGPIEIQANSGGITAVFLNNDPGLPQDENPHVAECIKQLHEYFTGMRKNFSVPIILDGTDFQRKVWAQLENIPYGKTVSYSDIAVSLNNSNAARVVGSAIAKNKIAIIIPCHRVIGKNKKLTGYAWGISRKEWLIKHEAAELSYASS